MKTSAQFDINIAEKHGVEASIVWELLDNFCKIQRSMHKEKMYREEVWWCKCPDEVFDTLLPYINEKKRKSIIEKLISKGLVESSGDEYTTHLRSDDSTKKPKTTIVKKLENEDRIYTFNKLENGEVVTYDVAGSKLVAMLIHEFRFINPDYEKFYGHPVQRKALLEMVQLYPPDILFNLLAAVPETNKQKYAPVILTPLQFKSKAAQLITFIQRESKTSTQGTY